MWTRQALSVPYFGPAHLMEKLLLADEPTGLADEHLDRCHTVGVRRSRQEHQAPSAWDALPGQRREWARTPSWRRR
jgi:hypothetical protein